MQYTITTQGNSTPSEHTGNSVSGSIQVTGVMSTGTGSAVVTVYVSNDRVNWIALGTVTLSLSTTPATDGFAVSARWNYVKSTATTLTANGSVDITTSY